MKNTKSLYQEFLDTYREMENALKEIPHVETDTNVKWWEDLQTDGNTQTKLRLYRLIRNYCVHETDYEDFITISKGMIDFLKGQIILIRSMNAKNSDVMTPLNKMSYIKDEDTLITAVQLLDKKKMDEIPVLSEDNKFIGFFTNEMLYKCILKNSKMNAKLSKLQVTFKKHKSFAKESDMYDIDKGITFITDNGKSTGTIIGIVE